MSRPTINCALPPPFAGQDLLAFVATTEICTDPALHPLRDGVVPPPKEDSFGKVGRDGVKNRWRNTGRVAKPNPLWGMDARLRDCAQNSIDAIRLALRSAGITTYTLHTATTPPGKGWNHSRLVLARVPGGKPFVVGWWGVRRYEDLNAAGAAAEAAHMEVGNIGLMNQRNFITGESNKDGAARGVAGEPIVVGTYGSGLKDTIAAHLGDGGAIAFDNFSNAGGPDAWNTWSYSTSVCDDAVVRVSFNSRKEGVKAKNVHPAASAFGLNNFVVTRAVFPESVAAVKASFEKNTAFAADLHTRAAAELGARANNGVCVNAGAATYTSLSRVGKYLLGTVTFPETQCPAKAKASQFNLTMGGVYLATVSAVGEFSFGVPIQSACAVSAREAELKLSRDRSLTYNDVGMALAEVWEGALRTHAVSDKFSRFIEGYVKADMMGPAHLGTAEGFALRHAGYHPTHYPMINSMIEGLFANTVIEKHSSPADFAGKMETVAMCAAVSAMLPSERRFQTRFVSLLPSPHATLTAFLKSPPPTIDDLVTTARVRAALHGADITKEERELRLPWFPTGSPVRFVEFDMDLALLRHGATAESRGKMAVALFDQRVILQSKRMRAPPDVLFSLCVGSFPDLRKSILDRLTPPTPLAAAGAAAGGSSKRNAADDTPAPAPAKRAKKGELACPRCECALDVVMVERNLTHSNDGETAVVVGDNKATRRGFVGVIDGATGELLSEVPGLERPAHCVTRVVQTADGCWFVVGFANGRLQLFRQDAATKALVAGPHSAAHTGTVWTVAANSTGRMLASASSSDTRVHTWDVDFAGGALHAIGTVEHDSWIRVVAWSPTDDSLLATGGTDGRVHLFNVHAAQTQPVATIDKVATAAEYNSVKCMAFAPSDGATIAVGYGDGQVARWNVGGADAIFAVGEPIKLHNFVTHMQYSLGGTVLATTGGGLETAVKLWDATGLELVPLTGGLVLEGHSAMVTGLEFNPSDSSSLLTCYFDGTVRRWMVDECGLGLPFEGPSPPDSPPPAVVPALGGDGDGGDGDGRRMKPRITAQNAFRLGELVRLTSSLTIAARRDLKTKQIVGFSVPRSNLSIPPSDARQVIHDMVVAKHGSAKLCSLFQ